MEGPASSINSRATAIKTILLAAWRGKLTNEEWESRIRKVLPRGVNADVYDLADCLLKQALIGPVPNQLFISYLKHAVQSELVSHSAVLQSISNQPINLRTSSLLYRTSPIVCLLNFLKSFRDRISCDGTEIECLNLCHSLSGLIHWLLKCILTTLEYIKSSQSQQQHQYNANSNLTNSTGSSSTSTSSPAVATNIAGGNQQNSSLIGPSFSNSNNSSLGSSSQLDTTIGIIDLCTETIHYFITRPFTKSLLFINKIEHTNEFKENILKTVQIIQQELMSCQHLQYIQEKVQYLNILHQLNLTFNSRELHPSMVAAQQLRYLQTHRIRSTQITSGSNFERRIQQYNSSQPGHNSTTNHALFNCLYPLVAFDAILRPARLNKHLARQIIIITNFNSAPINMTYCELIRVCLIGLIDAHGIPKAKASWSFFTFLKLPRLLIELNKLVIKLSCQPVTPPNDPNHANNFINDLRQAFERLCEYSPLLDEAEYKCNCDLFKCLIKELMKNDSSLIQLKSIDCRKFSARRQNNLNNNTNPLGGHMMLKTEPVVTTMLETLNSEQDPAELFSVLTQSCSGISFEYTLSAAAATGRLHLFVRRLIEHNELYKTPQENSTSPRHIQAQALNFDITFLILIYIAQRYGPDFIDKDHASKATFNKWYHERYNQDTCFSCPGEMLKCSDDATVSSLIKQLLSKGHDVQTNSVNWHDVCFNLPKAISEIINAWTQGTLNDDDITVVIERLRSRMCFMAVVASAWLQCYIRTLDEDEKPKLIHFLHCLTKPGQHSKQHQFDLKTDGFKERSSLMCAVVKRVYFELAPARSSNAVNHNAQQSKNNRFPTQATPNSAANNSPASVLNNGNSQSESEESQDEAAYHSYKDRFISTLTTREIFLANVKECLARGWIDYDSMNSLNSLFKIIGSECFTDLIVEQILTAHESPSDLSRAVNITFGLFHLDIEACAFALINNVIPSWLIGEKRQILLNQPRAFALANLAVMTIIEVHNNLRCSTISVLNDQSNFNNSILNNVTDNYNQIDSDRKPFCLNGIVKQESGVTQVKNSMIMDTVDSALGGSNISRVSKDTKRLRLANELSSNDEADQMSSDAKDRLQKLNSSIADLMHLFKDIMSESVMSHRTLFPVLFLQQTVVCAREESHIVTVHLQPDILLDIIDLFSSELTFELVLAMSNLSSTNSRKYSAKAMCKLAQVKESNQKSVITSANSPTTVAPSLSTGYDTAGSINRNCPSSAGCRASDGSIPMIIG
jgi:mediator of RNA polymerase II transcription subunit 24